MHILCKQKLFALVLLDFLLRNMAYSFNRSVVVMHVYLTVPLIDQEPLGLVVPCVSHSSAYRPELCLSV